jgi:prepilin signal peptidase PulO-like enzyme (type II secretory pathway)
VILIAGASAWSFSDATTGMIRHRLTIPVFALCLLFGGIEHGLIATALGLVVALIPLAFYFTTQGRWIGGGDVMAVACVGAALGFLDGSEVYLVANLLSGSALGLVHVLRVYPQGVAIESRLGPYLAGGVLFAALFPLHLILGVHQ